MTSPRQLQQRPNALAVPISQLDKPTTGIRPKGGGQSQTPLGHQQSHSFFVPFSTHHDLLMEQL